MPGRAEEEKGKKEILDIRSQREQVEQSSFAFSCMSFSQSRLSYLLVLMACSFFSLRFSSRRLGSSCGCTFALGRCRFGKALGLFLRTARGREVRIGGEVRLALRLRADGSFVTAIVLRSRLSRWRSGSHRRLLHRPV